jgi:uncharacterized membrane protein
MNVNFEYSKTLALEGSILLLLGIIPYVGWVLAIIGVILFLRGMKELSNYYEDKQLYDNSWTGIKYYIVAIVAVAVAGSALILAVFSATGGFAQTFTLTAAFGVGALVGIGAILVAFVFYVLAATHLRKAFDTLAAKSNEASFTTAGTLLWWGAILTIVFGIGLILILVAWIFVVVGFFTMKSKQHQQYLQQQNGYYTAPPQQTQQSKVGGELQ